EALDSDWVNTNNVELSVAGAVWNSVVELVGGNTIRVTPILTLPTATNCTLTLRGDQDGLHDLAGNVLAANTTLTFTTSDDAELPEALILPPDGAVAVATSSNISIVFDAPMDPATLTSSTVQVTDDSFAPVSGERVLSASNRVLTFTPDANLLPNAYYRVKILSGNTGARRTSGNWFDSDRTARFRTGVGSDGVAPTVTASINGIPSARRDGLVLPPTGFTIDVSTTDSSSQWVDMG